MEGEHRQMIKTTAYAPVRLVNGREEVSFDEVGFACNPNPIRSVKDKISYTKESHRFWHDCFPVQRIIKISVEELGTIEEMP